MNYKKLDSKIKRKIVNNEIKMKPKWQFVALDSGIKGVWLLTVLAVAVAMSMIVYFSYEYNLKELVNYGEVGIELWWSDFPYLWLLAGIIFFEGGFLLLLRIGDNYKKSVRIILAITTVTIIIASGLMVLARELFHL